MLHTIWVKYPSAGLVRTDKLGSYVRRKCKRKEIHVWTTSKQMQTQMGNFPFSCVCISHVWTGETQTQDLKKKKKKNTGSFSSTILEEGLELRLSVLLPLRLRWTCELHLRLHLHLRRTCEPGYSRHNPTGEGEMYILLRVLHVQRGSLFLF